MANAVDGLVNKTSGKEAMAVEAFARALRRIPMILADNGGYDSIDLVAELRVAHHNGESSTGFDMYQGKVADMRDLGVYESYKSKRHVVSAAHEAAEMILRVDEIVRCAPRRRQ